MDKKKKEKIRMSKYRKYGLDERNKAGIRTSDLMRSYGAHNEEELDRRLRDKYNSLHLGPLTDEEFKNLKGTINRMVHWFMGSVGGKDELPQRVL